MLWVGVVSTVLARWRSSDVVGVNDGRQRRTALPCCEIVGSVQASLLASQQNLLLHLLEKCASYAYIGSKMEVFRRRYG
jgi:hypothetical protein